MRFTPSLCGVIFFSREMNYITSGVCVNHIFRKRLCYAHGNDFIGSNLRLVWLYTFKVAGITSKVIYETNIVESFLLCLFIL